MKTRHLTLSTLLVVMILLMLLAPNGTPAQAAQPQSVSSAQPGSIRDYAHVSATLDSAPVMFVENVGQFDAGARFQVRGGNGSIYLADDAIWFTLLEKPKQDASPRKSLPRPTDLNGLANTPRKGVNLRLSFVGSDSHPRLEPFNRLDTHVSYFIGSDPQKWRSDVPVWGGVRYKELYPGIDLEITSEDGQMVQRRGGWSVCRETQTKLPPTHCPSARMWSSLSALVTLNLTIL